MLNWNLVSISPTTVNVCPATRIVSPTAGTTTDPVEKAMELLPLGPVLFIDTAGIDDVGALGAQRVERTMKALDRTELAILVLAEEGLGSLELGLLDAFEQRKIPVLPVLNKSDRFP